LVRRKEIRLPGDHNLDNVMAASLAGRLFGVSIPNIRRAIRNFKGLEHRLEKVLCLRGVEFINDSKATSVEATIHALRSFQRPVVLILGGRDKGDDFTRLRKFVRTGVRKVILIGEAGQRIRKELTGAAEAENAGSLKEAVSLGFAAAGKSGIVLLSPACSSFDMFDDFEHRGRAFKKEVSHLAARLKKGKI
jgi:UDP-N-acetylmuramoylalanine--D-glutamate ligase